MSSTNKKHAVPDAASDPAAARARARALERWENEGGHIAPTDELPPFQSSAPLDEQRAAAPIKQASTDRRST